MTHSGKLAPLAAVVSAVSCMACCLPFGIATAGSAALGVMLEPFRPYLMSVSGGFLLFGLWQLYRGGRACQFRSRAGIATFWTCAAIVLAVLIAPQFLANLLADL